MVGRRIGLNESARAGIVITLKLKFKSDSSRCEVMEEEVLMTCGNQGVLC